MTTDRTLSATRETTQTTVHVLHTGSVNIDRSLAFREQTLHPMPYTGWLRPKSKRMWAPVSAYLIDHPEGPVLVDTGWHNDIRTDQRGHLGFLASTMYWGRLPAGQAVHEQLASHGVHPEDLEYVVMSHLHSDHASGLEHVRDAKHIVVSAPEWDARNEFGYIHSMWDGIDVTPFDLTVIPFGPFKQGLDLFGDGLVYLVFTPGHSAGHLSVLTKTGAGWVLLAGDVGYAAKSWEDGILPGVTTDDRDIHASLTWVKDFAARDDCVAAFANHDPDVTPTTVG